MPPRDVELDAARHAFLTTGRVPGGVVPAALLASWERSHHHDVDPERLAARFLGHQQGGTPEIRAADDVLSAAAADAEGSTLLFVDPSGVVRVRRDTDPVLGELLDRLLLVPGYGHAERAVGTTAAAVALHEQRSATVHGAQHYHAALRCLAEAAAPVADARGEPAGAVVVVRHDADASPLQLAVARMLADRVTERAAGEPHRRALAVLDAFTRRCAPGGEWVLAGDGDVVLTNGPCRALEPADQQVLADVALAGFALREFAARHVDLPSGTCAEIAVEPVELDGALAGFVLTGAAAGSRTAPTSEAVRRQGSHVAPMARRDYAQDLRPAGREHAEARIRANRELLSPYLRARNQVVASVRQGRNHLLIGESGVGKRTLVTGQFREVFPTGRVVRLDCVTFAADPQPVPDPDGRPYLLLLHGLTGLGPVGARRLDEALRPLVALRRPPLLIACLDSPSVDATRPYGLLLRHFHEVTRVPALRYRADELGEIALAVLRRVAGTRSLRLSLQVVRMLEGYAWPGNISELEDVLRYVVARKHVGEIQPPDLPPLCFQGRSRRLSMLEAAQCDAIIQALYESRGNRYQAAAMLGIARSSLYRKIDAFGISYIA